MRSAPATKRRRAGSFDRRCQRAEFVQEEVEFPEQVSESSHPKGKKSSSRRRSCAAVQSTISKSSSVQERAEFPEQLPEIPHPHGEKIFSAERTRTSRRQTRDPTAARVRCGKRAG